MAVDAARRLLVDEDSALKDRGSFVGTIHAVLSYICQVNVQRHLAVGLNPTAKVVVRRLKADLSRVSNHAHRAQEQVPQHLVEVVDHGCGLLFWRSESRSTTLLV